MLDVLRGFALCGILLGNIHIFSGFFMRDLVGVATTTPTDDIVLWLTHWLVDGKFYSLFSLLFGIGFYVFMERAEAKGISPVPLFRRRLRWLLTIGLVHAVFFWSGDILTLYALLGFLLVPFRNLGSRTQVRWALGLLALPVGIYGLMWASGMNNPLAPPTDAAPVPPGGFDPMQIMLTGYAGGYFDVLQANAIQLVGRWIDLFITLRFPKVLGMFVLGLWIGRNGLALDIGRHAGLLRRVLAFGVLVGLPANAYLAWGAEHVAYLPGSAAGFLYVLAYAVGVPSLALAYGAGIALLAEAALAGRLLAFFAPVGRMALTNYLLQTVICMFVFYGFGLGLFGQTGPAMAALIALAVFTLQVPLSHLWLRRYSWGPAEWIWRRLTYRSRIPLRRQLRASADAIARPAAP